MKITLYTIVSSPFCQQAKEYLSSHNLVFEEKDVESNKDNLNEMLTLSDHFTGVPFVHIAFDDGTEAGLRGFTESEFDQAFAMHQQAQPTGVTPIPDSIEQPAATPSVSAPVGPYDQQPSEPNPMPQESMSSNVASPVEESVEESVEPDESVTTNDNSNPTNNADIDMNQFQAEEVPHEPIQQDAPQQPVNPVSQQNQTQQLGDVMKNLMEQTQPAPTVSTAPTMDKPTELPTDQKDAYDDVAQQQKQQFNNNEHPTEIPATSTNPSIPDFPK